MIAASVLLTALWTMGPHAAHAADVASECIGYGSIAEELKKASVVFIGDVVAIRGEVRGATAWQS